MKNLLAKNVMTMGAALLLILMCVPVMARAATDRLTVEDPATGVIKFKVDSDGNLKGASFVGAPTDGAAISIQQGPTEAISTVKLAVIDTAGTNLLGFDLNGFLTLTAHYGQFTSKSFDDNPLVRPVFVGNRARGTTVAPTAVQLNDKLGTYAFAGYDGGAYQSGALLESYVDDVVSSGSVPARLSFVTGTGPSNRAERLVVKSTGNVGIGTTSPTQLLDVNGNGIRIRLSKTPASSSAACNQGDMAWDAGFVYVCVSNNVWKRALLATF